MKRAVKWSRATEDKYGDMIRVSKCGRFSVLTRKMASGRNGYWNDRAYELRRPDGTRIGVLYDTLSDALDMAEFENNPHWEPDT